jgi:hypothetical protein
MNTPEAWSDLDFEVEITADGSPSLRQLHSQVAGEENSGNKGESMHHSGGAAAETELIYGHPIRLCFRDLQAPHFVSVGLGLGYVELVVARESLLKQDSSFTLESWELVPELKSRFLTWLSNQPQPLEIQKVYDLVLDYVLKGHRLSSATVKQRLLTKYHSGEWALKGALTIDEEASASRRKAHGLLFDAFSAKTTPSLWTEEFLKTYFTQTTAADSFISTYASRTSLKNALKSCEFEIQTRPGFQSKRNSTLAFKGLLKATFAPVETF